MVQVCSGEVSAPRKRRIPDSAVVAAFVIAGATCSKAPRPTAAMTVAAQPRDAIAELGPAAFDASQMDRAPSWTWDDYVRGTASLATSPRFVVLTRPYPGASSAARYGYVLPSGDKIVSWMIDGDPVGGYRLVADLNRDGDLADDRAWPLARGVLYRIDALPAYFVIDRDGRLACTRCQHAAADAALAKLFADSSH